MALQTFVFAILVMGLATGAVAEDITARLTADTIYTDETLGVLVEIGSVDEAVTALDLRVPTGFEVEGPIQRGRRSTFVNGVSRSWTEFLFRVQAPAHAKGAYPIGPVVVTYGSRKTSEIAVGEVRVGPRPDGGILSTLR